MIVKCSNCNCEMYRLPCQVESNKTGLFFCTFSCKSKYQRRFYKVNCIVCGKEFEKNTAEQRRYPVHCCSIECRAKNNDRRVEIACGSCGKKLKRPPSVLKDRKRYFCSVKCHDKAQSLGIKVKCCHCKKKFIKQRCIKLRSRLDFCSTQCRSKHRFKDSFVESEFERMIKETGITYVRNDHSVLKCGDGESYQELDFYFPTIKFAVEINGAVHYLPMYGKKILAKIKERDRRKKRRCKKLGITLRIVKPGNCKKETYVPRYKRVIWEIKKRLAELNI